MSEKYKKFEIKVGGRDIVLEVGKCAVVLFRQEQEVDYIAVDIEDEAEPSTLRIFNNEPFARFMGGYALQASEDGFERPTVYMDQDGKQVTFRELTGWNPVTIEKERPTDWEREMWVDINARDIDQGLEELLG